ncbi:2279_t:CDS:2, partial [Scutellospora calospora]
SWLVYYYKAWSNQRPTKLLAEFEAYRVKKVPFDDDTYEQFADINQTKRIKERTCELEQLKKNIALPITDSDTTPSDVEDSDIENSDVEDSDIEDSDQELLEDFANFENDDTYITTEEDWKQRLEEWREMLAQEENAQELNIDDIVLDNAKYNNKLLSLYTHPAIDIYAKWPLHDLFIRDLERPSFISISDLDFL